MNVPSLQHEIKKHQPFTIPAQELYLNLVRTAGQCGGGFHCLFKKHGLSETGYNVLRILRGAAESENAQGLPCLEVASRLITRVPDITRLVNRLIEAGLVVRTRATNDRRIARVSITPAGLTLLKKLDAPVRKLHEAQFQHLSTAEIEQLIHLLEKARQP